MVEVPAAKRGLTRVEVVSGTTDAVVRSAGEKASEELVKKRTNKELCLILDFFVSVIVCFSLWRLLRG
jgi:hypothetical protein